MYLNAEILRLATEINTLQKRADDEQESKKYAETRETLELIDSEQLEVIFKRKDKEERLKELITEALEDPKLINTTYLSLELLDPKNLNPLLDYVKEENLK
jgi:hypothetical protein